MTNVFTPCVIGIDDDTREALDHIKESAGYESDDDAISAAIFYLHFRLNKDPELLHHDAALLAEAP